MEALTHTWVVLAALLLVVVSYLLFHPLPFQRKTTARCPPQIWTYLSSKPTPQQSACIASWRAHHPTWAIHIMTPHTVHGFLHHLPPPHEAPIFRDPDRWKELIALTALEEHGGVWMDPTTLLRAPLTDFLPDPKEMAAFQHSAGLRPAPDGALPAGRRPALPPSVMPLLDKRILACPPHHPLLRQWRSEFLRIMSFPSVEDYLQSLPDALLVSSFSFPQDWVMSLALQHVLLVRPYPMESLHLLPAERGPLQHLEEARGDPKKAEAIAMASQEPIVWLGGL